MIIPMLKIYLLDSMSVEINYFLLLKIELFIYLYIGSINVSGVSSAAAAVIAHVSL